MLTDSEKGKLRAMSNGESERFIAEVFTDDVCRMGDRIRREKGDGAFDLWMDGEISRALSGASVERQDVRMESPDHQLFQLAIRKMIQNKAKSAVELPYSEALILAQKENPELVARIKDQMDALRKNPPAPWER